MAMRRKVDEEEKVGGGLTERKNKRRGRRKGRMKKRGERKISSMLPFPGRKSYTLLV